LLFRGGTDAGTGCRGPQRDLHCQRKQRGQQPGAPTMQSSAHAANLHAACPRTKLRHAVQAAAYGQADLRRLRAAIA
jgi:hypothetical protein